MKKKKASGKPKNLNMHGEMRFSSLLKIIKAVQNNIKSKNDIKKATDLSWGSCSEIITLLEDKKVITADKADTQKTGKQGRKAIRYTFNTKRNLICGMEIKPAEINCSISTLGKSELFNKSYPLKEELDEKNIFKNISSAFINCLVDCGLKSDQVIGLVIALIGGVEPSKLKWVYSSRVKKIKDLDFHPLLNIIPSIKYIRLEHDINAQASSVVKKYNLTNETNHVFIHMGEGIGASIYNDKVYLGARGFAGEIGHIPFPEGNNPVQCTCGKMNCVETILSTPSILSYINKNYNTTYTRLSEVDQKIFKDKALLAHISDAWIYIIVLLTNLLDPQIIIAGGEAIEPFYSNIQKEIEAEVRERSWLNGPPRILWFKKIDVNCAYGSIINSCDDIIEHFVKDNLL
jgi:predicted NBD/HSP70 family sugar kinase